MGNPVDRKPLAVRVADVLMDGLRAGKWPDGLPGYRVIAEHFDVGWRTSRAALALLEQRGILDTPRRGAARCVRSEELADNPPSTHLLVISSSTMPADADEQELLDGMSSDWTRSRGAFRTTRVDYRRFQRPDTVLKGLVRRHAAGALLMREPSREWVNSAMKLDLPVFFMGGAVPTERFTEVSGFAFSLREMVTRVAGRLRKLGHDRILMPDEGRGEVHREAILSGLLAGTGKLPPDDDAAERRCPRFSQVSPATWQRYWAESFRRYRPTAVIVEKEFSYLSLQGYCFRKGIRIPEDLSVVCLSSSKQLEWCEPAPDRIAFPNQKGRNHFRRWMKRGMSPVGMRILEADYVSAGTVLPTRSTKR